jgi:4'-phosphopantetheinyl transferase
MPNCCFGPNLTDIADSSPDRWRSCIFPGIAPDIRLCLVDIQALVRDWFGDLEIENLRRPARDLSALAALRDWLAPAEWETVQGFKALKRQVEWLAGRLAVKTLVTACLDAKLPPMDITVSHEPRGAPSLPLFPGHCLSITHAGRWAAAAVSLHPARALGIDIERLSIPATQGFLDLVFSPREQAALDWSDPLARTRAWTLKEAYLKYIRRGFHRSLRRVELIDGKLLDAGRPVAVQWTVARTLPDYLLAVVFGPRASTVVERN